jgi:16S rRNA C1402 N4-methylase RsmH
VVLTHKAVIPSADELEMNPRAASAKLRALKKL